MTTVSAEPLAAASPQANAALLPLWNRATAIGTGFGIAIGERNLEAVIVRARPGGPAVIATTTIHDFRHRPAAEWGAELQKLVSGAGESRLAAVVLLPRSEVVVRVVSLPGVAGKDIANAIELQIDTLHPWGEDEVAWGWSRAGGTSGNTADILVGLARQETLGMYETLFAEAGIPLASATFSPAVIHAALRIWNASPRAVLCLNTDENGRTEVYGESESRAVFSAEFAFPPARAAALARAELRLPADYPAASLSGALPGSPRGNSFAYAAALAGSARSARFANLLPAERRASHDRVQYLIPAALALLVLVALAVAFLVFPAIEQRRFDAELDRATRQLEPAATRARTLERAIAQNTSRIRMLDEIRRRPQADLEVLNELTRILPETVWANSIEILPDSVTIAGEADQAAPLLKLLDSSPLFQNSEFVLALARSGDREQFRIRTMRRGRIGRQTP